MSDAKLREQMSRNPQVCRLPIWFKLHIMPCKLTNCGIISLLLLVQAVMQKLAKSMDPKMLQSIGGAQNMLKMMKSMTGGGGGDGLAEMMQVGSN